MSRETNPWAKPQPLASRLTPLLKGPPAACRPGSCRPVGETTAGRREAMAGRSEGPEWPTARRTDRERPRPVTELGAAAACVSSGGPVGGTTAGQGKGTFQRQRLPRA